MSKVHEVKPEKVAAVADIVEKLKNAQSVVICSYSGLTVEQVNKSASSAVRMTPRTAS